MSVSQPLDGLVRRMNKAGADATTTAQVLLERPGSRSARRVSVSTPQQTLNRKGHKVTVEFTVAEGTQNWLKKGSVDFYEAGLPNGVFTKVDEIDAYGIGVKKLREFNARVGRVRIIE